MLHCTASAIDSCSHQNPSRLGWGHTLAINGGSPVRSTVLPYGQQSIDEEDIAAVVDTMRSAYLTTGPKVGEFEEAVQQYTGATYCVAVCNGTAALHTAAFAAGIGPGDEVIVATMTFAASSNAVLYLGATVKFADCHVETMLIDLDSVRALITPLTKAIVAVDMCGQPCDYEGLRAIADEHSLVLIADASHSLGATFKGRRVGTLADLTTLSFHPVKNITTGEGGMVCTNNELFNQRARMFRGHGINRDHNERSSVGAHYYEMQELGFNYRITDIQCALGINQLKRLDAFVARRQAIAARYHDAFVGDSAVLPIQEVPGATNAHHLFVLRLRLQHLTKSRDDVFDALRAENIAVNVHYIPVHLHPYYLQVTPNASCPTAEALYKEIITLPVFPAMSDADVDDVVRAVKKVSRAYSNEMVTE